MEENSKLKRKKCNIISKLDIQFFCKIKSMFSYGEHFTKITFVSCINTMDAQKQKQYRRFGFHFDLGIIGL